MRIWAGSALLAKHVQSMGVSRRYRLQKVASFWALTSGGPFSAALDWRSVSAPNLSPTRCLGTSGTPVLDILQEFLCRLQAPDSAVPKSQRFARSSKHDLASDLASHYLQLDPTKSASSSSEHQSERVAILHFLATKCMPIGEIVSGAIQNYQQQTQAEDSQLNMVQLTSRLRDACTPGYERLFQHVLEEDPAKGLVFLVSLREDLLLVRQSRLIQHDDELAQLKQLDAYLRELLTMWFSPGMLEIRRITYEGTSAYIMETIATKEAVHPLKSLQDLRSRLGNDRRVFAAFHPLLPNEPLVFCHVALRSFVPSAMNDVLETIDDTKGFRVATFYSISSTQQGLSGIDLGQFLIKQAVNLLRAEFTTLDTFVTLSPLPRFRLWLKDKLLLNKDGGTFVDESLFSNEDTASLADILDCSPENASANLLWMLDNPSRLMGQHAIALKPLLMKLAARYLVHEKHRRKPLDGVARFHIRNGAEMYRLNYQADVSRKGLHNSLGIMINYRYNLDTVEENQLHYETSYQIPVSEGVEKCL